jgi:NAD(P)H dehydrogenase (quinone)
MYAITGVTGRVGGELARTLRAAGLPVRAILRDAAKAGPWQALGCEIALARMEDAPTLTAAFEGATAVFVLPPPLFDPSPGYPEARVVCDSVAAALGAARPGRVVSLSTVGADAVHDNLLSQRTLMETALRPLAMPVTFLRPAWFIENAAWDVGTARDTGVLPSFLQPVDKPFPMVATGDVGHAAARLMRKEWQGVRVVELEGPRRLSANDLAAGFAQVLDRPVEAVAVARATWEELFRAQGMKNPQPRIRMLDGFNEGWIDFSDGGRDTIKGSIDLVTVLRTLVDCAPDLKPRS